MKPQLEKSPELKNQEEVLKQTLEDNIAKKPSPLDPLQLPADVASNYKVAPGTVRVFLDTATGSLIDLNVISTVQADKLAARGILIKM
jgi:hypothetical protein